MRVRVVNAGPCGAGWSAAFRERRPGSLCRLNTNTNFHAKSSTTQAMHRRRGDTKQ